MKAILYVKTIMQASNLFTLAINFAVQLDSTADMTIGVFQRVYKNL